MDERERDHEDRLARRGRGDDRGDRGDRSDRAGRVEESGAKLTVTQWIQITTALLTMLAGGGVWIAHGAGGANPEATEFRQQMNDLTKQVIQLELEHERMKYQLEDLERLRQTR